MITLPIWQFWLVLWVAALIGFAFGISLMAWAAMAGRADKVIEKHEGEKQP